MKTNVIANFNLRIEEYVFENDKENAATRDFEVYNENGDHIGSAADFLHFAEEFGITHYEKNEPTDCICTIGFNDATQTWYGWSHRGIFGFQVGSKVKKGDCAYRCKNKEEFAEEELKFFEGERYEEIIDESGNAGVMIYFGEDGSGVFREYPSQWGKGEWEARTLDDAKQMAKDYADGVS